MSTVPLWAYVILPLVSATVGSITGWWGNHCLQSRLHNHYERIDQIRQSMIGFRDMIVDYWIADESDERRKETEARILVGDLALRSEFERLARINRKVRKSFEESIDLRAEFLAESLGGMFQENDKWKRDLERAKKVTLIADKILRCLD